MSFFLPDDCLNHLATEILSKTRTQFPSLESNQIALTWIVYDPPVIVNTGGAISAEEFWKYPLRGFHYRGDEPIYPASLIKLFYLVAIHEWLQGGMIPPSAELDRAIRDMIVDSSNDATSLVVDYLTGTTSGPELSPAPFATWKFQRSIVNRYFKSLGWSELEKVNLNQKTWSDGPYGREKAFVGESRENCNLLTTNAVARLFHTIVGGIAVSSERSQTMLDLLKRSLTAVGNGEEENQVTGFLGGGLPSGAQLWSKAGWTSQVRHDAAYIEIPDLSPYLLVVFTEGEVNSQNQQVLPFISQEFALAMTEIQ